MNLIDEEDIQGLQGAKEYNELLWSLEISADGLHQPASHFVGDDSGQRRFSQARGSRKKDMADRGLLGLGRSAEDLEDLPDTLLANEVIEAGWADALHIFTY